MSKHTPGPWCWVNSPNDEPYDFLEGGYPSLRTVEHFGENKTEVIEGKTYTSWALPEFILDAEPMYEKDHANARLIAAAPDLLEALQELRDLMQGVIDGDYEPDSITLQVADAAILKAKGESA